MMAAHKNAVVIGNNREKKQPLVVAMPVNRLIILDTERREAGEIRHPPRPPAKKKQRDIRSGSPLTEIVPA